MPSPEMFLDRTIGPSVSFVSSSGTTNNLVNHLDSLDIELSGIKHIGQTVTVAKNGGNYTSISGAIEDPIFANTSANNPASILIYPGVYTELPVTLPAYTTLSGIGGKAGTKIQASGTTQTIFNIANEGCQLDGLTIQGASGSGGIGILANYTTTPNAWITNCLVTNCDIGVKVDNGTELEMVGVHIEDIITTSIQLVGTGDKIEVLACEFNHDIVLNSGTLRGMSFSETAGDQAMRVHSELHVGNFLQGQECSFGEGDSHTVGMSIQTNTDLESGVWTDNTSILKSSDGSTVDLLAGTGINNCVYLGGDTQFPGIKAAIVVPIGLGSGALVPEYWNGSTWTSFNCMSADSEFPFEQYATAIFGRVGGEQSRFDEAIKTAWSVKSLNGVSKYWARMRVASNIITSPTLEQIKLHTNRTEANIDGSLEYFGTARVVRSLPVGYLYDAATMGSANQNILVGTNSRMIMLNNNHSSTAKDGAAFLILVPEGIDTSMPLNIKIRWAPNANGTGDVEISAALGKFTVGDIIDGTLAETIKSDITTISSASADVVQETNLSFSIADALPGDAWVIAVYRDATAGNLNDTMSSSTRTVSIDVTGSFWR